MVDTPRLFVSKLAFRLGIAARDAMREIVRSDSVGDSLYGFRVYPIQPLMTVMRGNRFMRRFDFDPEAVVRLCWAGVRPVNLDAPVRYLSAEEGGVSHFKYLRDNSLLTWMHTRLFLGFLLRLPLLIVRRLSRS